MPERMGDVIYPDLIELLSFQQFFRGRKPGRHKGGEIQPVCRETVLDSKMNIMAPHLRERPLVQFMLHIEDSWFMHFC
jgi:hypothetical protein